MNNHNKAFQFNPDQKIDQLIYQIENSKPFMPQFLVQQLMSQVGFCSSDKLSYKLISCLMDYELEKIICSIKNIKTLKKRKDEQLATLYFKDVASQIQQSGIAKPQVYPILDLKRNL